MRYEKKVAKWTTTIFSDAKTPRALLLLNVRRMIMIEMMSRMAGKDLLKVSKYNTL
jgi:hypothetical protein